MRTAGKKFPFLGLEIAVGPHEYVFDHAIFQSTEEGLRQSFEKSGGVNTAVEWVGTERSTMEIRLIEPSATESATAG